MPRVADFEVVGVQAVIFTPNIQAFAPGRVLAAFITQQTARYNGPITSLPLPADAPPEAPHVLLQSADNMWRLQASPARIDSVWGLPLAAGTPVEPASTYADLASIVAESSQILESYVRTSNVKVGRLALVVARGYVTPNPAATLITRFCSEAAQREPFNHSSNFEIHNHKIYALSAIDLAVNSWVRCRTGQFRGSPAIGLEQDINTLEEAAAVTAFSAEQIRDFFRSAQQEADEILRLYFPEENQL